MLGNTIGDLPNVIGGRSATTPNNVCHTTATIVSNNLGILRRRKIVFAKLIWKTCIWVGRDEGVGCDRCKLIQYRPHLSGAQRAIKSYGEGFCMLNAVPKCFISLP